MDLVINNWLVNQIESFLSCDTLTDEQFEYVYYLLNKFGLRDSSGMTLTEFCTVMPSIGLLLDRIKSAVNKQTVNKPCDLREIAVKWADENIHGN